VVVQDAPLVQASWLAAGGSSTNRSASDQTDWPPKRRRLATSAFRNMEKVAVGTAWPTGVGAPPVQDKTTSGSSSLTPPPLMFTAAVFAEQVNGWPWATEDSITVTNPRSAILWSILYQPVTMLR